MHFVTYASDIPIPVSMITLNFRINSFQEFLSMKSQFKTKKIFEKDIFRCIISWSHY